MRINSTLGLSTAFALSRTTQAIARSIERLSSSSSSSLSTGARDIVSVNESMRLSSQVRALNASLRATNDAQALAQTAIAAIAQQMDIVDRIRSIASQSVSSSITNEQRKAFQLEIKSMIDEFNRITAETEYNSRKLLDGSLDLTPLFAGMSQNQATNLYSPNLLSSRIFQKKIGTGTFDQRTTLGTGTTGNVKAADLNNDGKTDLVSVDGSGTVSIYLGRGDGTYGVRGTAIVGASPYSIQIADLNRDGRLDIVSADQSDNTISVSYGRGDGTFATRLTLSGPTSPTSVAIGDFNLDGISDILSLGTGALAPTRTFSSGLPEITSLSMIAAGIRESTQFTMTTAGGGAGVAEITDFTFDPIARREVSSVTLPGASGVYGVDHITLAHQTITTVTLPAGSDLTADGGYTTGYGVGSAFDMVQTFGDGPYPIMQFDGFYVWFNDGFSFDPGGGSGNAVEVGIGGEGAMDTANLVIAAISSQPNVSGGAWTSGDGFSGGFANFDVFYTGTGSSSFQITDTSNGDYYLWFKVDGVGSDPGGTGTGVEVDVSASDNATAIASAVETALSGLGFNVSAGPGAGQITITSAVNATTSVTDGVVAMGGSFGSSQSEDSPISSGQYFRISSPSVNYYVWFDVDGAGGNPAGANAGRTGIEVDISSSDSPDDVAAALASVLDAMTEFTASATGRTVDIGNSVTGVITAISDGNTSSSVWNTSLGLASSIAGGSYFTLSAPGTNYYVWYQVDGVGSDPNPGGTGIEVDIVGTADASTVAAATRTALNAAIGTPFSVSISTNTITITNSVGGSVTDVANGNMPGGFSASVTTQGTNSSTSNGDYFRLSSPSTNYYVWFDINNTGVNPSGANAGRTGIEVDVAWDDSAATVASKVRTALNAVIGTPFSAAAPVGSTITVTNSSTGVANDAVDGNVGGTFSVNITQQGAAGGGGGGDISAGDYFRLNSPTAGYYVWFRVDGAGSDPSGSNPGRTGIQVDILSTDNSTQVATKVAAAIDATAAFISTSLAAVVTVTNAFTGTATDASDGNIGGSFAVNVTAQGTSTNLEPGDYFLLNSPTTNYYVWFQVSGAGSDPAVAGRTGVQVNVNAGDSATAIGTALANALNLVAGTPFAASNSSGTVTVTNTTYGPASDASGGTISGFTPIISQQGMLNVDTTNETISLPNHGYSTGQAVTLTTTGSLPGGLAIATTYYLIVSDANTLKFATSLVNANAGTAINLTNVGSGTHTINPSGGTGPVVTAAFGNSSGGFTSAGYGFSVGNSPTFMTTADFNGDGILDLVARDSADNTLSVLLGNGDGTFKPRTILSVGANTISKSESIVARDINRDGKVDVISLDADDDLVSIFIGVGDGTFGARTTYSTGDKPSGVQLADFNSDGVLDLVTSDENDSSISIRLGNGNGSFQTRKTLSVGSAPKAVLAIDVNGDGVPDLVSADSGSTSLSILKSKTAFAAAASDLSVASSESSQNLLDILDRATENLKAQRGNFEALHSGLEARASYQLLMSETLEEARSKVLDIDIAHETAELVRLQILRDVQTAVLAQANLQLSLVLQLLRP